MLDDWAFARVELDLKTDEFFALSDRQWDALLNQWKQKKERERAMHLMCSLNARWGSKGNPLPFTMADFLPSEPKSKEEQAAEEERLRKNQGVMFQNFYKDLVRDLPAITQKKQPKRKTKKSKRGRKQRNS